MTTLRIGAPIILSAAALYGQGWTQLQTTGNPPAGRAGHSAVFDPTTLRMFVFGGAGVTGNFNDTWTLTASGTPSWSPLAAGGNPPQQRSGHTAVYDAGHLRMIVYGGGTTGTPGCLNDVWILSDPNSQRSAIWTPVQTTGSLPASRRNHSAVYDPNSNRMIVFGGNNCRGAVNEVWILSNIGVAGAVPTWTPMQPSGAAPPARQGHVAVYDAATNRMFVFGGDVNGSSLNDLWVLNNANGSGGVPSWSQLSASGTPPTARTNADAIYDSSNRMIVYGGNNGSTVLNDAWALSGLTNLFAPPTWTQLPAPNGPLKTGAAAVYDVGSNRMIVFGGVQGFSDPAPVNDTWALSLTQSQNLTITTTSLPPGQVGLKYSAALLATGGSPPYRNWQIGGGTLPPGLQLDGVTGTISGTPTTTTGSPFTIRVTVQDSAGTTSPPVSLTITIGAGVTITTTSLPNGSVGANYGVRLTASNGTPPYVNWRIASGALPPGLNLDPASGAISGVPTSAAGSPFAFTVTVNDSAGNVSPPQSLTIAITQGITITPTILPGGSVGVPYSVQLVASGGTAPYSNWTVVTGTLPAGLTLNAGTGIISGTPTTPTGGPFLFSATVKDNSGVTSSPQALSITVGQGVAIVTTSLPNTSVSAPYSVQLTAAGGTPPYNSWLLSNSILPAGLILSPNSGVISGIPLTAAGSPFSFSVTVRDSSGNTSPPQPLSITVFPRVNITTAALPNATVGTAYSAALTAADGIPPYGPWQLISGLLPPGVTLNPSTGALSGTPTSASGSPFPFNVTVKDSAGGTSLPQSLTINFGAASSLTATPSAVSFTYRLGDAAPPAQSVSVFQGTSQTPLSVTVRSDQNFLSATPTSAQSPAAIALSVNTAVLGAAGTLTGQAIISGGNSSVTVNVTLTVVNPGGPQMQIAPELFSLTATQGAPASRLQLTIFNHGSGTLNFSLQLRLLLGNNWLSLDGTRGTATFSSPASVGMTLSPATLQPNTYTAEITVTDLGSNQTQISTVLLAVSARSLTIQVSQAGLEFTGSTNGAISPPQTFAVSNTGQGPLNWSVVSQTLSGGAGWLAASPSAGRSDAGSTTPPLVTVSLNPAGVPVGRHFGVVRVTAPGAANSPQVVSVVLNVTDAAQGSVPVLSDAGALVVSDSGAPAPAITVANLSGRAVSYVSTKSTDDGRDWLSLSPASGTLATDRTNVTIVPNLSGLPPGIRHGTLRMGFSDGSVRTLSVTSIVPATSASAVIRAKDAPRDAGTCTPRALVAQFISPEANFTVTGSAPVSLRVAVTDDCGTPLQTGGVFFRASNDSSKSISLVHAGNGNWNGTWVPPVTDSSVSLVVSAFSTGNSPIGGQTPLLGGTIRSSGSGARPNAIFNAASLKSGDQVSLGSWVSVFGDSLADGEAQFFDAPFGRQLLTTEVRLGDQPLPLYYVNPKQVNALIPRGLNPNTQHQIVVQRAATVSVPIPVTVAEVQPGIFTVNQQGTGQGAIEIANTTTLAAPAGPGARPARRGEAISIFCSGLGAVTIAPDEGAAASLTQFSFTLATPTVSIGGVAAAVPFSGLAPGLVGVYQVNVVVPDGAPSGSAVTLVLAINGIPSNPVTVAVE
jgi:uncharacterized protein (TIGR03437 family)